MSVRDTSPCPAWCERDHANVQGVYHRAEVGHLDIQGKRLMVVVIQSLDRPAAVMLSGPESLVIEQDQTEDIRGVFTLLGFPFLAQLIERAAWIVDRHNTATRHAASVDERAGS